MEKVVPRYHPRHQRPPRTLDAPCFLHPFPPHCFLGFVLVVKKVGVLRQSGAPVSTQNGGVFAGADPQSSYPRTRSKR